MHLTHPCNRSITCRGHRGHKLKLIGIEGAERLPAQEVLIRCIIINNHSINCRINHSIYRSTNSSTLHAEGTKLLPAQVDGMIMLLSMILLHLLKIRPSTNVLQTLLRVPNRDQFLGLMGEKVRRSSKS